MASLNTLVLDNGLSNVVTGASRRLDICGTEPTTYTAATTTNSLGNKTGITIAAPAAGTGNNRKCTIPQVASGAPGSVTANGTAAFWALTDPANSRLIATGAVSPGQVVTNGNTWTTTGAIDIELAGLP